MSASTVELRRCERLAVKVKVTYESLDDFLCDYTANVSLGGMFIQTQRPLAIGSRFRLRFAVPGHPRPVETTATVCWISDEEGELTAGMGVVFDSLAPAEERRVASWLAAAEAARPDP